MSHDQNSLVRNVRSLYLNPTGTDVTFIIHGERIPGHKLILSASCPYYSTMFYGSLPEDNEVDLTQSNISVESFKEFLKCMYMRDPNLTMDNIEGVINLARQSLSDGIFAMCGEFLKNSLKIDNVFFVYQLALLYDIKHLETLCEEEICVHAEKVLKSSSLLEFPYDSLQIVLKRDALACEEIDILNACLDWAKAACKRNTLDPSNGQHLREQLRDLIYQFRFTSMTKHELSKCIRLCPGLFTADELEEIVCMVAHDDQFQTKRFNWTPRYFDLDCYKGRRLQFARVDFESNGYVSNVSGSPPTKFSCNRRVLLKEFSCVTEGISRVGQRVTTQVIIKEVKSAEDTIERFNESILVNFDDFLRSSMNYYRANISLNKAILLRPNCIYEIWTTFEYADTYSSPSINQLNLVSAKKRVDHDIVFNFEIGGAVSGLSIYRFDNKNYFQKVIHNPKSWLLFGSVAVAIGAIIYDKYPIEVPVTEPVYIENLQTISLGPISNASLILTIFRLLVFGI